MVDLYIVIVPIFVVLILLTLITLKLTIKDHVALQKIRRKKSVLEHLPNQELE